MKKNIFSFSNIGNVLLIVLYAFSFCINANKVQINSELIKELEIINLIPEINRTQTNIGLRQLYQMITHPINDETILKKRQTFIQKLAVNNEILTDLQNAIKIISETESSMYRYIEPLDKNDNLFPYVNHNFFSRMTGLKDFLNSSSKTLQGVYGCKLGRSIWWLISVFGFKGVIFETVGFVDSLFRFDFHGYNFGITGLKRFLKRLYNDSWSDIVNQHKWQSKKTVDVYSLHKSLENESIVQNNMYRPIKRFIDLIPKSNILSSQTSLDMVLRHEDPCDIYNYLKLVRKWPKLFAFTTAIGGTIFYDLSKIKWMMEAWPSVRDKIVPMQALQSHLVVFSQLMRAIKTIIQLQAKNKLISNLLPDIRPILQDEKIQEIFKLLETETFKKEYTFLFNHGRVLYTHKLITENLDKIIQLFLYIGELDSYVSIAQLYNESKSEDHSYCFVEYVDSKNGAIVDCNHAWFPLFSKKSAIQNINLGIEGAAQNMVITGPNMSGKSIYLKMVGLSVLFAQTITIVPAQSCKVTLFNSIYSCLDPLGDVSKGLSKFASQKLHLERILQEIKRCDFLKPGLFLIDEILSGTVESEIARRSRIFGNQVAHNPYAITLITTHVEEPIKLEEDTKGLFKNFHIEIIPLDDGTFKRTFKIKPGYAPWWFNNEQLRILYTDWIELPIEQHTKNGN